MFIKLSIIKMVEYITVFCLFILFILENKSYLEMSLDNNLIKRSNILIKKPKDEFGPLKMDDKSQSIKDNNGNYEYKYGYDFSNKVMDVPEVSETAKRLKRRQISLAPTKP
jgi:hypothetical protein